MTDTGETILDRYISFADRAAEFGADLGELRTIFSDDAVVEMMGTSVSGIDAIMAFYDGRFDEVDGCKHYWTIHKVDDRTLEADWVAAARRKDGRLATASGFERALLNEEGLIRDLRNYPDRDAAAGT